MRDVVIDQTGTTHKDTDCPMAVGVVEHIITLDSEGTACLWCD
jgi:hypothetical protein